MQELPNFDPFDVLGVDSDATDVEITLAWRQLQRLHHPDVAGPEGLESARRINVARDWLLDPALRSRLPGRRQRSGRPVENRPATRRETGRARPRQRQEWAPPPDFDPWSFDFGPRTSAIVDFLRFVSQMAADVLDRLEFAHFGVNDPESFHRFLPRDLAKTDIALRAALDRLLPKGMPSGARMAAIAYARSILLGDFLYAELPRDMADRMMALWTRDWQKATTVPRYGERDRAVREFVERVRRMSVDDLTQIGRRSPAFRYSLKPDGADAIGVELAERDALGERLRDDDRVRRAVGYVAGAISAGLVDSEEQIRWWRAARQHGFRGTANRLYAKFDPW